MIDVVVIDTGAAVGSNGVATANADKKAWGKILAVGIVYLDSPPAGSTDVILSTPAQSNKHPVETILTKSNSSTNAWYYPRRVYDDNVGAIVSGEETEFVASGILNAKIDQANADDSAIVTVVLEN